MAVKKGRTPCGESCPFYEISGSVHCIGGAKKSNCRLIMENQWVNCNIYDVRTLETIVISEKKWRAIKEASGSAGKRVRKPWKYDHKEIHHIGENTRGKRIKN